MELLHKRPTPVKDDNALMIEASMTLQDYAQAQTCCLNCFIRCFVEKFKEQVPEKQDWGCYSYVISVLPSEDKVDISIMLVPPGSLMGKGNAPSTCKRQ